MTVAVKTAFSIVKRSTETYGEYAARKLRAAVKEGFNLAPVAGSFGYEVYADDGSSLKLLVMSGDRADTVALFNKVGAHVPGFAFA